VEEYCRATDDNIIKHMHINSVLRGIFGPERDEVTNEWRRIHNEELYDLCSAPNMV